MFSVAPDGFAKIVELVRHGVVDRLAGILYVISDRLGNVLDWNEIPELFGATGGPLDAAPPGAPHGGARQLLRFPRQRAGRALATSAKEQRDAGTSHDTENRGGQKIVLIAITLGRAVLSV
jgi:hypothetical protein